MKKIYQICLAVAVTLSVTSCFKLDQEPYVELSQKNSFQTPQDAQFWVNGMYNNLRANFYGSAMYASDIQTDYLNLARRSGDTDIQRDLHNWSLLTSSNATLLSIWQRYFRAIQDINMAIEGIPSIPISTQYTASETAQINRNMGELYLGRAFYHAYLLTHYCLFNDQSSAYGLPIMDHFMTSDFPARSSVSETFDFILADITRAENLLSNVTGTPGLYTFSKDAATALKARVMLYKGDWAGAYAAATSLITANRYPLTTTESALTTVWANDGSAESITLLVARYAVGSEAELPERMNVYIGEEKSYITGLVVNYFPIMIPTQTFVDLFDSADIRKNVYIKDLWANYGSTRYSNIYLAYKFPDNDVLKNSPRDDPSYLHRPKIFRVAEQYLIAAEAAYRLGDQTNAQTYLNQLRTARGIGSVTYSDLWTEIQNERSRELCFEGYRMIDIKRWGLGIVRGTPQNVNLLVNDDPTNLYELNVPAGNAQLYKLSWPLPPDDVQNENGKWQQNPGW
ncbi:membrane protein [Capnocytophaga sp. HP1101]